MLQCYNDKVMKRWSLEELVEKSQRYLTDEGDSRRVQWKPNGRQIRYYSTLGLVDKPDTENGRVVWYGPRHLVQLLALKRLQLDGLKLSEIQRSLAGATLEELRRLAGLPPEILEGHRDSVAHGESRHTTPFWEARPAAEPEADFHTVTQLAVAPGVTLTVDPSLISHLSQRQREQLARAFVETWRTHQPKNEEKP